MDKNLKNSLLKIQALAINLSLTSIYGNIKELEPQKKYQEIITQLEQEIQKNAENLGSIKSFRSKLQYVLSGRFSEQRNNPKTHEVQTFFSQIGDLPEILILLTEKRTQILRLMQRGFHYMEVEKVPDLKTEDAILLQEYVSEFRALEKQTEGLLKDFK